MSGCIASYQPGSLENLSVYRTYFSYPSLSEQNPRSLMLDPCKFSLPLEPYEVSASPHFSVDTLYPIVGFGHFGIILTNSTVKEVRNKESALNVVDPIRSLVPHIVS